MLNLIAMTLLDLNNPQHFKATAPTLWQAVCNVRKYSTHGRKILDFLAQQRVSFCLKPDMSHPGLFDPRGAHPVIYVNPAMPRLFEEMIAHESFHAVQHVRGLLAYSYDQSLGRFIMQGVLTEAGAVGFAAMATYEMKLNGLARPFDVRALSRLHMREMGHIHRCAETAYKAAFKEKKMVDLALLEAGKAAFEEYSTCIEITKDYFDRYLRLFIKDISKHAVSCAKGKDVFNAKAAKDYGWLNDRRYLSERLDLRRMQRDIFANNEKLRDAVIWLDHVRLVKSRKMPDADREAEAGRQRLKRNGNPYHSIDFDVFKAALAKDMQAPESERKTVIELLDSLSTMKRPCQQRFDFSKTPHPAMA